MKAEESRPKCARKVTSTFRYDVAGNVREATDPLDHTALTLYEESTEYAFPSQVTDAEGLSDQLSYDFLEISSGQGRGLGLLTSVTGPNGRTTSGSFPAPSNFTSTAFDGLSRPVGVTTPDGQSVTTVTTSYRGPERTSTDQAGSARRITSDGLGRTALVREPDPESGSLDAGDWTETRYGYDAAGRLLEVRQGFTSGDGSVKRSNSEASPMIRWDACLRRPIPSRARPPTPITTTATSSPVPTSGASAPPTPTTGSTG